MVVGVILLSDAIGVSLRKTCPRCSKALSLHAVGHVATRSVKLWTSSATMALELYCPQGGGFQIALPMMEVRVRLVTLVEHQSPEVQSRLAAAKKRAEG